MPEMPPDPRATKAPRRSGAASNARQEPALTQRLLKEAFLKTRPEAEAALAKCFASPETVLACLELLARLEGELP